MRVLLLIAASVPFFRFRPATAAPQVLAPLASAARTADAAAASGLRRIRPVPEAEIIALFLRNEFHHAEFAPDRHRFSQIVMNADISDPAENALRRALLFRRRGTMWRELPPDSEWWEVEATPEAIGRFRVFPRAQWRKLASGSFILADIVNSISTGGFTGRTATFLAGIRRLSEFLRNHAHNSAILLIGIDENEPLTILEGNHRVTAAMLNSPELARSRFRFYCGFSPRMTECCWYHTSLATLYRYGRNRLKVLMYDREADIAELLTHPHSAAAANQTDNPGVFPPDTEVETRHAS
jgi:hypothetical protein